MRRTEEILKASKSYVEECGYLTGELSTAFIEGAEWADKSMIDKACEWLKQDMVDSLAFQGRLHRMEIIEGIVENFRKAMED